MEAFTTLAAVVVPMDRAHVDTDAIIPKQFMKSIQRTGCGSSREHAVWALHDYGIRALVAPSFADIFFANCFKNGLLPIVLDAATIDRLFAGVAARPGMRWAIDLPAQTLTPEGDPPMGPIRFSVDPDHKHRLLNGLDPIGLTLAKADAIRAYETRRRSLEPWLFDGT